MIKREPYVGMPIILGEYDDIPASIETAVEVGTDQALTAHVMPAVMPDNRPSVVDIDSLPIAMAYVPMQKWTKTYIIADGFKVGTIFPDLNLPFEGYKGGRRND